MPNDRGGNQPQGQQGQRPTDSKVTLSVKSRTGRNALEIQVSSSAGKDITLRIGMEDMPFCKKLPITLRTEADGIKDYKLDLSSYGDEYDRLTAFVGDVRSKTVMLPGLSTATLTGHKSSTSHLKVKPEGEVVEYYEKTVCVQVTTLTEGKPASRRLRIEIDHPATFANMVTGEVLVTNVRVFFVDSDANGQVSFLIYCRSLETNLRIVDQETGQTVEKTLRFI